jgi:hypothetical protein
MTSVWPCRVCGNLLLTTETVMTSSTSYPGSFHYARSGKSLGTRLWHHMMQSRSPSLRSSGRNARLWDTPFQGGIWLAVEMRSSILATIPGFRQRIFPEPRVPSRGSQAQGTRLVRESNLLTLPSNHWLSHSASNDLTPIWNRRCTCM